MTRFSPKIEIINHFDNLINKVDIDIEQSLEKYNQDEILGRLVISSQTFQCHFRNYNYLEVNFFETSDYSSNLYQKLDSLSESTKVVDYLKQVRMRSIEELRREQENSLEYYKLNSSRFKALLTDDKTIDELRSELFAEKFYFQVKLKKRLWAFNLFTFVTDFYISQEDIESLEKLINGEKEPFCRECVFDEKMVLIGLLHESFIVNLYKLPNHIFHVCRQDVKNIESIHFKYHFKRVNLTSSSAIDLSKLVYLWIIGEEDFKELVEINIDGLSSLNNFLLILHSAETSFSITNLSSLKRFILHVPNTGKIDENMSTCLGPFQIQSIENLDLEGDLSYFNLDNLVNLRSLTLTGTIKDDFNFDIFMNLCNQLQELTISYTNIDAYNLYKLFDGHHFSNLITLALIVCDTRVDKKFIDRFPMLQNFYIHRCNLELSELDVFSNLKRIHFLDLSGNRINLSASSNSKSHLQTLDLCSNEFSIKDPELIGFEKSVRILIENNNFTISDNPICKLT